MVENAEKLLVALKHHGDILGRKRFQKIIFLLIKKHDIDFKYSFISHLYGPYSRKMQLDINVLNFMGLIDVHPGIPYLHVLTEKGLKKAEETESRMRALSPEELETLKGAIEQLKGQNTIDLTTEAKSLMNS